MTTALSHLQPTLLWQWFAQICAIPHPSHHEEALVQYIIDWAKSKQFDVSQDAVGNVLIRKPATAGMQHRQAVALQAHVDMVPQANADTPHDFTTDPIRPQIVGEWVKAQGTTLGADNGIGLASMLAVLESTDVAHPDLEVLITRTEETGMVGAIGLAPNWLNSTILINTDTEEIGEIYIGCAGGIDANLKLNMTWHTPTTALQGVEIRLSGLSGGHSGIDIHLPKGNALQLLARLLKQCGQHVTFNLSDIRGGTARNAIPREATAQIWLEPQHYAQFEQQFQQASQQIINEYQDFEKNIHIQQQPMTQTKTDCLDLASSQNLINLLTALPNGVKRFSASVADTVESSVNLGVVELKQDLYVNLLVRSLNEEGKQGICTQIQAISDLAHAEVEFDVDYVGWTPAPHSTITQLTQQLYQEILQEAPLVKVIHAGLECGLLKKVYPDIDMVSIGPTIHHAHSPDEQVHIDSVAVYWQLLTRLLANIPERV